MFVATTTGESILYTVLGLAVLTALLGLPVINAMKGKWWFALFAMAGGWLGILGAIRLAKPHSYWARRWYGEEKMAESRRRFANSTPLFGKVPDADDIRDPQDSDPWPDDPAMEDRLTRLGRRR
jgi:hypothetical protein